MQCANAHQGQFVWRVRIFSETEEDAQAARMIPEGQRPALVQFDQGGIDNPLSQRLAVGPSAALVFWRSIDVSFQLRKGLSHFTSVPSNFGANNTGQVEWIRRGGKPMGMKRRRRDMTSSIEAKTEFINVDLDLAGPSDLAPLVAALNPPYVLHCTSDAPFVAILEAEMGDMDVHATVEALLCLIEDLDEAGRSLWNQCSMRRFNIGIQSGLGKHSSYPVRRISL